MTALPELKVTVYSDYICPFCYLGHHRLQKLKDSYELKINWCFLEIHPELSAQGDDIEALDYSSEHWQQLLTNLRRIAEEEGVTLNEPAFITNSRYALLLAEAGKQCGREIFYRLHEALFAAYFVDGRNIGSRDVLRDIAADSGVDAHLIESAWTDDAFAQRLSGNYHSARQHDIESVPAFVFGNRVINGVLPETEFRRAARDMNRP